MPPAAVRDRTASLPGGAISPLVPVLVPLAVAAIAFGVWFSRLFPFATPPSAPPPVKFTDVTRESGLDFVHDNGAREGLDTPTTLPGAVAFLDYDNDGHPDLFVVSGTAWPWAAAVLPKFARVATR